MNGLTGCVAVTIFILFAQSAGANPASGITYHGRILKPDGEPLQGEHVSFRLQIRTPGSENCLLYEEVHSRDMRNSNGIFSLTLNDGTATRGNDSGLNLERVFQNHGIFTGLPDCKGGSNKYTPSASDGRRFAVFFRDETMPNWVPLPATLINFVPLAIEARSLGGFNVENVIRVEDNGVPGEAPALSSSDVLELEALLKGTSTQYMPRSSSAGAVLPSYSGGEPSAPQAGSIWYDSNDGSIKFHNGSETVTLGTGNGSGTVTSITAGEGLTGGTITTSGTISLEDVGTPGTYYQVTIDQKGRVVSGKSNLDASDIPDLDWSKITTGKPTTLQGFGIVDAVRNAGGIISIETGADADKPSASTPGRIYVATDAQKIYLDDGNSWVVVASVDVSSGGTVTNVTAGAPLSSTGGATPHITIERASSTKDGYLSSADWIAFNSKLDSSLDQGHIFIGNTSNQAAAVAPSGDLSVDHTGQFTVTGLRGHEIDSLAPSADGQVLRWNGSKYAPGFLTLADIRAGVPAAGSVFPTTACGSHQTLRWDSLTDSFTCQDIAITTVQVTDMSSLGRNLATAANAGAARTAIGAMEHVAPGASGNVLQSDGTNWVSAPLNISASNFGAQAPNQVLAGPVSGGNAAPAFRALVAADIPNLPASQITSGTFNPARMPALTGDVNTSAGSTAATVIALQGNPVANTPPSNGQVLKWNGSAWEPAPDNAGTGTVTQVNTGSGLTGGPITSTGTISIATGGVQGTHLAANAVTTAKIADAAITTAKIGDNQVTDAKIANVSASKLTGTIDQARLPGEVKFASSGGTCNSANEGLQRYNSSTKKMEFCNGTAWIEFGGAVSAQTTVTSSCSTGAAGYCNTTTAACPSGYVRSGCSAYASSSAVNVNAYPSGSNACRCFGAVLASTVGSITCYNHCVK